MTQIENPKNLPSFNNGSHLNEVLSSYSKNPSKQLKIQNNNSLYKVMSSNYNTNRNPYETTTTRKISTRLKNDIKLDFNYKELNLRHDTKSVFSSENKSHLSDKYINTFILDKSNDSISLKNNIDLRILIIDDEDLIRRSEINIVKKYCKKEKINIIIDEACDGAEGLYKIFLGNKKGVKYDIIFTDETMNFMNGNFTAKIIKSLVNDNIIDNIKIIMITSYETKVIEDSNKQKQIDYIYSKPLSMNILENIFSNFYNENN